MEKELADARQKFRKQETASTTQRREIDWKLAVVDAMHTYIIVLKDDTELSTSLFAVSQEHDLAQPILDRRKTPRVKPAAVSGNSRIIAECDSCCLMNLRNLMITY